MESASVLAEEIRITESFISQTGHFTVGFQSSAGYYYVLHHGENALQIGQPISIVSGRDGMAFFPDPVPYRDDSSGYYIVESVPLTAPRDSDNDGLDDLYELRRPSLLNPLDPSDALRDPDGDGRTFLDDFLLSGSTGTKTFDRLSDLVNWGIPSVGQLYLVNGYHEVGDLGGGLFRATNTVINTNLGIRIFSGKPGWSFERIYEGPVNVRWFGVKGDGLTDNNAIFDDMMGWIGSRGGNVLIHGNPGDNYFIKTNKTVTNSFVTFDWRGATLTGHHRFIFDGDSGKNGDYSRALTNVYFKNAVLGGVMSQDETYRTRGPSFNWCVDSGAENIVKIGLTGTAFNVYFSKRTYLRNIWNHGGKTDEGGAIGFLVFHSVETLLDNCHVMDGIFVYGFQVKGGQNNTIQNSSCRDFITNPEITGKVCFRDRGDAPWGPSSSDGTYPFETGSWDTPDERRASVLTRWVNCSVVNCPDYSAYVTQESVGSLFRDCSYDNAAAGFILYRLQGGMERDFSIINPLGKNTVFGDGIRVQSLDPENRLAGVRVTGGLIERSWRTGLYLNQTLDTQVSGLTVKNNGLGLNSSSFNSSGMVVLNSEQPALLDCTALDDQLEATQSYGILISEASVLNPSVQNCTGSGNLTRQIQSWGLGRYANNWPGDGFGMTSGAENNDQIWRCYIPPGATAWVETLVIASQVGSTNQAVYRKGILVSNTTGTATIQGGVVDLSPDNETDPAWNHTLFTGGSYVRARVTGGIDQTITWTLHTTTKLVPNPQLQLPSEPTP